MRAVSSARTRRRVQPIMSSQIVMLKRRQNERNNYICDNDNNCVFAFVRMQLSNGRELPCNGMGFCGFVWICHAIVGKIIVINKEAK